MIIPLPKRLGCRQDRSRASYKSHQTAPVVPFSSSVAIIATPLESPERLYMRASAIDETDPASALELYDQAINADPHHARAHTNRGNCLYRLNKPVEAIEAWEQALAIDPTQSEALYNYGYLKLEGGDPLSAIPYFRKALDSDPSMSDAWFNLAMSYRDTNQTFRAQHAWRQYIRLEPTGIWTDIAKRHIIAM